MLIVELKEDLERKVQMMGILFRTHNWMSCELILKELVTMGLAKCVEGEGEEVMSLGDEVTEWLTIGQLFGEYCIFPIVRWWWIDIFLFSGMSDALTNYLVGRT